MTRISTNKVTIYVVEKVDERLLLGEEVGVLVRMDPVAGLYTSGSKEGSSVRG